LQDGSNKHDRAFGVPFAVADATEFSSEGGKEAFPNFAGGKVIAGRGELNEGEPATLPGGVGNDGSMEVGTIIIVGVVAKNGVEEFISRGGEV
jgi:hypothetical protein